MICSNDIQKDGWKIISLKDCIIQLNTGLNPRNNFSLGKGNIKYITAKNLTKEGFIDFSSCDFVDEEAQKIIHKRSDIQQGDVLFSSRAPVGHCHLITENPNSYEIGESIFSIRVNENLVLPEYLCLFLSSDFFINMASNRVTGSVIQEIRISDLLETDVIVPPKETQAKIAKCICAIDKKIEINKEICKELDDMAKTLFDYWFLQFDFPDNKGHPYKASGGVMVFNEELKKEIPLGWDVIHLSDIITELPKSPIQVNGAKNDGEYPFFTSGDDILCYDEYFADGFNCFLNTGGNPDVKGYKGKCAYSTDTWCINAGDYSYLMFSYFMRIMPQFEQLFFAGSGLKHLQKDALGRQLLVVPPKGILSKFNKILDKAWDKKTECLDENRNLTKLREFLFPLLMNGQVSFEQ